MTYFIGAIGIGFGLVYSLPPESGSLDKTVHISIDDCVNSLIEISNPGVQSIFDVNFFRQLREWHERYGAKFTLYVYSRTNNFDISAVPDRFRSEFTQASEYLKFGFHSTSDNFKETEAQSELSFSTSFLHTNLEIDRFAGEHARSRILRLDRFYGKSEWRTFLQSETESLLTPDDERPAYWLTPAESRRIISSSSLPYEDIANPLGTYWRTDARYENIILMWYALEKLRDQERIVIFTHEWAMDERVKEKMEASFRWFNENGYNYIL